MDLDIISLVIKSTKGRESMEYKIIGDSSPVLEIRLSAGKQVTCKEGAVAWMTPDVDVRTYSVINGPGSKKARAPQEICVSKGTDGMVALRTTNPGTILKVSLDKSKVVAYQRAYLASDTSIQPEDISDKVIWNELAEGVIYDLQSYGGSGDLFFEINGAVVTYELTSGEELVADPELFVCAEHLAKIDIAPASEKGSLPIAERRDAKLKLVGPGRVYFQTRKTMINKEKEING